MAGNNIQYTIGFNANTSQAKSELAQLQNTLKQIANMSLDLIDSGDIQDIQSASAAARELSSALDAATNKNTGKLDLSMFQKSISKSGNDLNDLISRLSLAGNTGSKAFQQLAKSVTNAHMPIKQTSKLMSDFADTMKNTIKWQLSSNIVHGLQSGLEGAISYAKNLNSSLNDIRIVTGASADEMARFSESANKAAKRLSATTLDYTKASLIYYQQGDDDATVKKKADLTLKAANASPGTSTEEMSEYLTAVWNSYKVGADELERYVDIMAALGAKTATSLEEIATSMQKVAATGNTVGVSMEQVSSIIATVSSVTRESAQSIGTSFKTIFARMGDLKLGKEDEDGIVLGQVSEGLEKIGVDILTANGDLRDMGDVITELGNKWQTMSNAEKAATAQLVAGKRQYTQLMALFENWDMYQENMDISMDSEGALQDMQDIYAESWEAASKRVKASLESVYSDVINDEAIIKITNGIADLIDKVHSLVDAFGGVEAAIGLVGSIFVKTMKPQITEGIGNFVNNLKISTGAAQKEFVNTQQQILGEMMSSAQMNGANERILGYYEVLSKKQSEILLSGKKYSQEEIAQIEATIAKAREKIEIQSQLIQMQEETKNQTKDMANNVANEFVQSVAEDALASDQNWDDLKFSEQQKMLESVRSAEEGSDLYFINDKDETIARLKESLESVKDIEIDIKVNTDEGEKNLQNLGKTGLKSADDIITAFTLANKTIGKMEAAQKQMNNIKQQMGKNDKGNVKINMPEETKEAAKKFKTMLGGLGLDETITEEITKKVQKALEAADNGAQREVDELRETLEECLKDVEQLTGKIITQAEKVSTASEKAMGTNVSDKTKGDLKKQAKKDGGQELNTQPQSQGDFSNELDVDFSAAAESAAVFADQLATLIDGLTTTYTGVTMLSSGIKNLISGNATLMESFIAIASGVGMTLNGLSNMMQGVDSLGTAYSKANEFIVDYIAKKSAEKAATVANTAAKGAETAAIKAADNATKAAMASNPLGWILAIVAAVIALASAIGGLVGKIREAKAAEAEMASNKLSEISEKQKNINEESEAISKALGTYKALSAARKDDEQSMQAYEDATADVLKALGLEAAEVEITKGKYEELAKMIEYANNQRNVHIKADAEYGMQVATSAAKTLWSGWNQTDQEFKDAGFNRARILSDGTLKLDDGGTMRKELQDTLIGKDGEAGLSRAEYNTYMESMGFSSVVGQDYTFDSDPASLIKLYNNMRYELEEGTNSGILNASEGFMTLYDKIAEMAQPLIELNKTLARNQAESDLEDNQMSFEEWEKSQKDTEGWSDKSQSAKLKAYFEYIEQSIMDSMSGFDMSDSDREALVQSVLTSWAEGLSYGDDLKQYQSELMKEELYKNHLFADRIAAEDDAEALYSEATQKREDFGKLYDLYFKGPSEELWEFIEYMNKTYGGKDEKNPFYMPTNLEDFQKWLKENDAMDYIHEQAALAEGEVTDAANGLRDEQVATQGQGFRYIENASKILGLETISADSLQNAEETGDLMTKTEALAQIKSAAEKRANDFAYLLNLQSQYIDKGWADATTGELSIGNNDQGFGLGINSIQDEDLKELILSGRYKTVEELQEALSLGDRENPIDLKAVKTTFGDSFAITQDFLDSVLLQSSADQQITDFLRLRYANELELQEDPEAFITRKKAEIEQDYKTRNNISNDTDLTQLQYLSLWNAEMQNFTENGMNELSSAIYTMATPEAEAEGEWRSPYTAKKHDVSDVIGTYDLFTNKIKSQSDLANLANDEEAARLLMRGLMGTQYEGMTIEDLMGMSSKNFERFMGSQKSRLKVLSNQMMDEGILSLDERATVVEANEKNKDDVDLLSTIINNARESADLETINEQKRIANEKAAEGLRQGLTYDQLDDETRYWLERDTSEEEARARYEPSSTSQGAEPGAPSPMAPLPPEEYYLQENLSK